MGGVKRIANMAWAIGEVSRVHDECFCLFDTSFQGFILPAIQVWREVFMMECTCCCGLSICKLTVGFGGGDCQRCVWSNVFKADNKSCMQGRHHKTSVFKAPHVQWELICHSSLPLKMQSEWGWSHKVACMELLCKSSWCIGWLCEFCFHYLVLHPVWLHSLTASFW